MNVPEVWTLKYSLRSGGKWKTALCSDVCPGGQKVPFLFESKEAATEFGESLRKNSNDTINQILADALQINFDRMKSAPQQAEGAPEEPNQEENAARMKAWLVGFKDLVPDTAESYRLLFDGFKDKEFTSEEALHLTIEAMRFLAGR